MPRNHRKKKLTQEHREKIRASVTAHYAQQRRLAEKVLVALRPENDQAVALLNQKTDGGQ